MRCIVPHCKNDSRNISKSGGITFHVFPNESSIRKAWLKALGKEKWKPRERSAICSEHFLCEDLYYTKHGLRKVRSGAIPVILKNNTEEQFEDINELKVCRICLAIDAKLFSMRKYKLVQSYEHLSGLPVSEEDKMPEKLCVECAHRLYSYSKFRKKSLKAHAVMTEIITTQDALTIKSLESINRENNQLTTILSTKSYEPNHADQTIEYDETETKQNAEPQFTIEVEIKDEIKHDIYNENIDEFIKSEDQNANEYENDDMDKDFVATDGDFSSDDSIPLEKQRKTTKLKRKKHEKPKKGRKVQDQPKIDRRRRPFLNADLNETLFTITELTLEEQLADIQKRQDTANYKNATFKCNSCFKGFLDEEAYNSHLLKHTNHCGEYKCEVCKTHFKHSHALRKHITAHHTQRFSCNQCPYVTTHRQTARLHERWHKGTKYKCPHCPDEFVKFTTYMGHIRIKHPSDFVCGLCGYSFVSEKGIDLHKKLKHRLDNDVQIPEDGPHCEVCDVRFISSEALKKHMSVSARHSNGTDKKSKESNNCYTKISKKTREPKEGADKNEKGKKKTERHVFPSQIRKAEGPIPCEQCDLQLEDSRAYHSHFRRMHPDKNRTNYPSMKSPCMCEVCGRMFQSFALLRDHTWIHSGERPFKCDSCGKQFRMKQRLVAHARVHRSVRATYPCALCGKQFSTHSNRQRHMFIHTGLKPFKCEMCGKGFKHASEKRAHIQYVHLKKPWPKRSRGKRRQDRLLSATGVSASEMETTQPMWPDCPKVQDMNIMNVIEDKSIYYNMKM